MYNKKALVFGLTRNVIKYLENEDFEYILCLDKRRFKNDHHKNTKHAKHILLIDTKEVNETSFVKIS